MRKLISAAVLATGLISGAASATSGNDLLEQCSYDDLNGFNGGLNQGACIGYISGVLNTLTVLDSTGRLEATICVPEEVKFDQLRDVTIKVIKNLPEYRHYMASTLVMSAVKNAFPCPK